MKIFLAGVAAALAASACVSAGTEITADVTKESVQPGTEVKRAGQPVKLAKGHLGVNDKLPSTSLLDTSWKPYAFKGDGKVKVVNVVPSVDTRVCEQQTHILGESPMLDPKVERVTVSRDLPAAQKRFALDAKLENITYLSDFKDGSFGRAAGLLMEEQGLLARAVLVVDGEGVVRYIQVVPDITALPDMERAFAEANRLVR